MRKKINHTYEKKNIIAFKLGRHSHLIKHVNKLIDFLVSAVTRDPATTVHASKKQTHSLQLHNPEQMKKMT